jgi:hypothetical protein
MAKKDTYLRYPYVQCCGSEARRGEAGQGRAKWSKRTLTSMRTRAVQVNDVFYFPLSASLVTVAGSFTDHRTATLEAFE